MVHFKDRIDAGKQLAARLVGYKNNNNVVVLGLARGGVVVAHALAQALQVPWDVIIVRKIGSPYNPEYALGAVAEDGSVDLDQHALALSGQTRETLQPIIADELRELERRKRVYRGGRSPKDLNNKIVILADDGVATGSTMRAALKTVRAGHPQKIIIAVPVAPSDFMGTMRREVDQVLNLTMLDPLGAISPFYESFPQVTDEAVITLLA